MDIFSQLQNASEAFRTYIRDGLSQVCSAVFFNNIFVNVQADGELTSSLLLILQMEKNAAAGRTPSSVPLATPPPSSLNLSSPKFAPLSPVHTNTLNEAKSVNSKVEPTSFSLPPSYAEDDKAYNTMMSRGPISDHSELRHQTGEQNERFPPGGLLLLNFTLHFIISHISVPFADELTIRCYFIYCSYWRNIKCN